MEFKMNGKIPLNKADIPSELLNPFVHHLELATTYEKIKTGVLTLLLLPLRVIAIAALLVTAWLLACVGLVGLNESDLRERPLIGWRRTLRNMACSCMRLLFRCAGFHWVTVRGKQASRREAPVLALAPHSSFFDSLPVVFANAPSIVAKNDTSFLPFFGKLINYTQPVYVWRDDPNSRQNTIKEIVQRATSDLDWPQVLIFPEGTCTNRSCLITFKSGAFYPGVPVQPVCIRYPNKLDTVTWTWEGPGALKLLWLTLTQLNSSCEIEFLPVYHPSPEERADPKLYASNVRNLMAKALGIPVSDYTYADCLLINRALELNIPSASDLIKVQKLRTKLGLGADSLEAEVESASKLTDAWIGLSNFCDVIRVQEDQPSVAQLFSVFDKDGSGSIDIRSYLLDCLVIYKKPKTEEMVKLAFKVVSGMTGEVSRSNAVRAMRLSLGLSADKSEKIFDKVDKGNKGHVTYDEFVNYARRRKRFEGIFTPIIGEDHSETSDESSNVHYKKE